uniref:response regulator transcription factor n=1 Tax=Castellaniella defragrans TaxID=75697 RepID=UPI0033400616
MTGERILIVEDEPTIAENLYAYLERQGFAPDAAYDGHGAMALLRTTDFQAMVLDLGLPGMGGMDLLRAMRHDRRLWCPVLVLTARDRMEDKLLAFEHGAEDYLVKPFALAEVCARLRVLLRRGRDPGPRTLAFGDLSYDPDTHAATLRGQPLPLPRKAALLLEQLLQARNRPATQAQLKDALWPHGPPSGRALNDQVHLLRLRLREAGGPGILTLPGQGWRLTPPSANAHHQE